MGYVLAAVALYLLFRFITGFVIPVFGAFAQMKRQVKGMAEKRKEPGGNSSASGSQQQRPKFNIKGDYIPFEEIK
jgi:hypothetical protein